MGGMTYLPDSNMRIQVYDIERRVLFEASAFETCNTVAEFVQYAQSQTESWLAAKEARELCVRPGESLADMHKMGFYMPMSLVEMFEEWLALYLLASLGERNDGGTDRG